MFTSAPASAPAAVSPISIVGKLYSAADLLEVSGAKLDDPEGIYVYRREGSTNPVDMTREAGGLLATAAAGFAELYPNETLRIDALRGAAGGALSAGVDKRFLPRLGVWATAARTTGELVLATIPNYDKIPFELNLPSFSRR